jgi:peptidyl-prolyl cis-trans isomerase B (cyclophilin B)
MTQPPPVPPQAGPPYPPYPPPVNTYAILSLVLGLAIFPPLGIYFGNRAKEQIAQTGERGVELATAGIVVGWILTSLYAVFICVWCGFVGLMISGSTAAVPG